MVSTLLSSYFRLFGSHSDENNVLFDDYSVPEFRYTTFRSFPSSIPILATQFTDAGFYYTGTGDSVKCFSCQVIINDWKDKSDPLTEHRKYSPYCDFVKQINDSRNDDCTASEAYLNLPVQETDQENGRARCNSATCTNHAYYLNPNEENLAYQELPYNNRSNTYIEPEMRAPQLRLKTASLPVISGSKHNKRLSTIKFRLHTKNDVSSNQENFKDEQSRTDSFNYLWPKHYPSPAECAKAGLYFTGRKVGELQCAFCSCRVQIFSNVSDPLREHAKVNPYCPFLNQQAAPRFLVERSAKSHHFSKCLSRPVNSNMSTVSARLKSFKSWPSAQSPLELANAGFFYCGKDDIVECFYCGGSLSSWEASDNPKREHSKWFPNCPFIQKTCGPSFIENEQNETIIGGERDIVPFTGRVSPRTIKARLDLPIVRYLFKKGYSRLSVRKTIERQLELNGDDFKNVKDLVNAVEAMLNAANNNFQIHHTPTNEGIDIPPERVSPRNCRVKSEVKNDINRENMKVNATVSATSITPARKDSEEAGLRDENQRLRTERQCICCFDSEREVVFLPCGHLAACVSCSSVLQTCPICRCKYDKAVRTFYS